MEPKEQNPDQMTEVVLQPTQPKLVRDIKNSLKKPEIKLNYLLFYLFIFSMKYQR